MKTWICDVCEERDFNFVSKHRPARKLKRGNLEPVACFS
jgi:hypothetical protein